MKHLETFLALLTFIFLSGNIANAQEVPGDRGRNPGEIQQYSGDKNVIPPALIEQYQTAKEQHDNDAKERLGNEIAKYLPSQMQEVPAPGDEPVQLTAEPPFTPDWYETDVMVHSGNIAYSGGFRQIDLKQGEDGWLYLALNLRPVANFGSVYVYRSSNGGASWVACMGFAWPTRYIQSVSLLVENRSNTNFGDSTKVIVYHVTSESSNFNDARLDAVSTNRTGANFEYKLVSTPTAGNKYEFPSSCSDGMYWGTATFLHCVVREATNAGGQVGLRHFLTTNWTATHSNVLINTGYQDYYPSIQYGEKNTGNDSIYIATERRLSTTEYELRLLATSEFPAANHFVYFISSAVSGVKYEKPELTVVQQYHTLPRKMLITCTRNRNPRFFYTSNGAATWTIDQLMGTSSTVTADFTTCNSDSLTSGGQYAIMGFVTDDGDSVNVKQLTIPPSTTYNYYKRNNNISSGLVAPSTAIYRVGTVKYAAFSYPGSGPTNIYFNSEQLVTAIEPVGNIIPDKFKLNQNYPNPFNPATNIKFSIPKSGIVKLVVYDLLGKQVAELVNGQYSAGTYKVDFDAAGLSSGAYFYKIETDGFTDIKKMILVK
jgi:hypothetical protein